MTHLDPVRLDALMQLGYTEREARFLHLVATHSGHFLRDQYNRFIGSKTDGGSVANALVEKGSAKGHIKAYSYGSAAGRRYHLLGKAVYRALGKTDSSNRRHGSDMKVGVRLTALDFVLSQPGARYLEEESDKVAYFTEQGVPRDCLPAKVYESWNSPKPACTRFFVDKFPVFLPAEGQAGPVTLTYIDQGLISVGSFDTHLKHYRPLLTSLQTPSRVVFVATSAAYFETARKIFDAELAGEPHADTRLLEYFRLRDLWEQKRYSQVSARDILVRNDLQRRYAAPQFEALYQQWLQSGETHPERALNPGPELPACRVQFKPYLIDGEPR